MSASSKKKLRKEQNAASMTQKQQAAKKEAKKMKIYTVTFWVILALCVSLVAGVVLKNPINGVINRLTTSVVVGDHKLNAVELNYFYIDAINEYCNENSSWISYLLDTTKPLGDQVVDSTTGTTWADQFLDMAISNAKNTYALYDAALKAGHKLSEEEQKAVQTLYDNMDIYASYYGYSNASDYLKAIYGLGSSEKSYSKYYEVTVLASSYYSAYAEDLKDAYEEVDLREYEAEKLYEYNSYSYASHYLDVEDFKTGGTKGEDGKTTYTDDEIKAAEEAVKQAAESLAIADNNTVEALNAAIAALEKSLADAEKEAETEDTTTEGETTEEDTTTEDDTTTEGEEDEEEEVKYSTASESEDVLYDNVSSVMQEWLRDSARKEGDITYLPYTTSSTDADGNTTETLKGYYIVLFQGVNDNTYPLANVRHILVAFEGGTTNSTTGTTTYTDAEKAAAREKAYEIYDEWLYGEGGQTEEHFSALAKEYTDDSNGEDGGLYEDIYPGQMVTNFNDWCFNDEREVGDHGVIETSYGYHIMFYSADSETNYRNFMITNDMLTEDMEEWQTGLNDAMTVTEKNTSKIDRDLVLSSST